MKRPVFKMNVTTQMAVLAKDALLHRRAALGRTSLEQLSDEEIRELQEIEAALQRIDNQDFGQCEGCGGRIGRHRLRALPETRYCMTCAERGTHSYL